MGSLFWFALLIIVLVFLFRFLAGWEHADFRIKVGPEGSVRIKGSIPGFSEAAIRSLVEDLQLQDGVRILGVLERGSWRVRARGVDGFTEQRIRNVLFTRLPR